MSARHQHQPRRVAVLGLFGTGNHGNDASLREALRLIRCFEPNTAPIVLCPYPLVVTSMYGVESDELFPGVRRLDQQPNRVRRLLLKPFIELAGWVHCYRIARRVDLAVFPGTGVLDDFGKRPRGIPYQYLRWALAIRLARCPLALIAVGAGPIVDHWNRRLLRATAALASSVSYRDERSRVYMRTIGRDVSRDRVVADIAFGSGSVDAPPKPADLPPYRVGLGVMAYYGWKNEPNLGQPALHAHIENLFAILKALLERGHEVRLLVGEHSDDLVASELMLLAKRRTPHLTDRLLYNPVTDFSATVDEIAKTDAVIVTRYHNVVAALIAGRPVLSIGYASKNRDLLERIGLARESGVVQNVDVERLLASTASILTRAASLHPEILRFVAVFQREVEAEFASVLDAFISANKPR